MPHYFRVRKIWIGRDTYRSFIANFWRIGAELKKSWSFQRFSVEESRTQFVTAGRCKYFVHLETWVAQEIACKLGNRLWPPASQADPGGLGSAHIRWAAVDLWLTPFCCKPHISAVGEQELNSPLRLKLVSFLKRGTLWSNNDQILKTGRWLSIESCPFFGEMTTRGRAIGRGPVWKGGEDLLFALFSPIVHRERSNCSTLWHWRRCPGPPARPLSAAPTPSGNPQRAFSNWENVPTVRYRVQHFVSQTFCRAFWCFTHCLILVLCHSIAQQRNRLKNDNGITTIYKKHHNSHHRCWVVLTIIVIIIIVTMVNMMICQILNTNSPPTAGLKLAKMMMMMMIISKWESACSSRNASARWAHESRSCRPRCFPTLPYDLALQMMMMTPVLEINCGPPHHKCLV